MTPFPAKEAKEAIAQIEKEGTKVFAPSVDITNEKAVRELITKIQATMPPLKGIFHGAMVLDDVYLKDLNEDRFRHVMLPKVAGALYLHQYTKDLPLDFFVSFSSIASIVGNPGQANYVAANAFLDAFAPNLLLGKIALPEDDPLSKIDQLSEAEIDALLKETAQK